MLSNYLLEHPVDFVFSINFFPFISEVCNIFHLPYLCWSVDSPVMELYSTAISRPYNRIFLFDHAQYEEIAPHNPDHVFHLPLAVNVTQKQQAISTATKEMQKRFTSKLSFVGSLYSEKCPYDRLTDPSDYLRGYLEGLMEAQLKVYGSYFVEDSLSDEIVEEFKRHLPNFFSYPYDSYLSDRTTVAQLYIGNKISALERHRIMGLLSRHFPLDLYTGSDTSSLPLVHNRGLVKTLEEMPVVFHNSQINLNITSKAIRSGIPLRIFDILGCEGFLITNYQTELADCFQCGEELIYYESFEDLTDKVHYYLDHPKLCQEIAHNGLERVRTDHTYPKRLTQMLELAFTIPAN